MLKLLKLLKTAGLSTVCSNTGIYLPGTLFQKSVQAIGRKQKRRCLSGNPGVFSGSRRSLRLRRVVFKDISSKWRISREEGNVIEQKLDE